MKNSEKADLGKELEGAVMSYLDQRSKKPAFYYHRFPDARTGRGRIKKQPADFLVWQTGRPDTLLDPKVLSTSLRLNIKSRCSQLPKMNRAHMAGVMAYFLVYHAPTDRYFPVSRDLVDRCAKRGGKSVNLAEVEPVGSLAEALDQIFGEEE